MLAILVTADVVGLYPSIPHNEGLEVLKKQLDNFYEKSIPTEDLVKMAEFVLKNNCFEFNSNQKHHISGTAIGTKFASPYIYIYGWTTWRISFSKMNKFSLGFGSGTLILFSFGQPVKKNMIFWNGIKATATDMRYFARSKLSRRDHKKNFNLIQQVGFKLGQLFCQERQDTSSEFE